MITTLASCSLTSDSLHPFCIRTFPISKNSLAIAINKLYSTHPEYKPANKWMYEDTSMKKAYFFLESRSFYFKGEPEEMYFVTFLGDSTMLANPAKITIAIRSVNTGGPKWFDYAELSAIERSRIEKRFDCEIISKLEAYTNTKAKKEDN